MGEREEREGGEGGRYRERVREKGGWRGKRERGE